MTWQAPQKYHWVCPATPDSPSHDLSWQFHRRIFPRCLLVRGKGKIDGHGEIDHFERNQKKVPQNWARISDLICFGPAKSHLRHTQVEHSSAVSNVVKSQTALATCVGQ